MADEHNPCTLSSTKLGNCFLKSDKSHQGKEEKSSSTTPSSVTNPCELYIHQFFCKCTFNIFSFSCLNEVKMFKYGINEL